jgi:hypothetical protein
VPNTVVLPDRLGRGGAARPPQPSSQGPAGAGDPGPRSTTPSPTRGRRRRPAQVMVGLMPPTLPLTACAPPSHSLGCTARIPAPQTDGRSCSTGGPWPTMRSNPVRCPSASTTTTRSSRRRRWPSTACAGAAARRWLGEVARAVRGYGRAARPMALAVWLPDAPTRSTKSPVRTQPTRTRRGNARTPTPDTRTPGHWTPDARTSHAWTPDTGRVDADRGCGQGDQATADIPTSGPPRRADGPPDPDAEPCSCGKQRMRRSATMTARR